MLYYLLEYLDTTYDIPGTGLYQYLSFRAGFTIILSLIISILFGNRIIRFLKKQQIGESVRDLGLDGQKEKEGTPTMGGVIIFLAIVIPVLLFARLDNVYVIIMLIATVWMFIIGFIDDYIKVFKKSKAGLHGKFKILGQVGLGALIGLSMIYHEDIVVRLPMDVAVSEGYEIKSTVTVNANGNGTKEMAYVKTTLTNVPFFKGNKLDYGKILGFLGEHWPRFVWLIFIPIVIFIVTAVSNAANITDGIDGLATGTSAIIGSTLGIIAWISGNTIFADYLQILYLPYSGELVVFSAGFIGACIGFLWYNSYPAKVFMGDTGSLMLGGIIASLGILLRKELLIPILCGLFLVEILSVMIQVSWFKYTRKRFGEGRRVFLMSPLHHHFQKKGMHESKIVTRFWIIGILLAVFSVITLKIR